MRPCSRNEQPESSINRFCPLSNKKGFSLIELLIVVAVIAILASIAYPSYSHSMRKARRADAMAALHGFAIAMERYYTEGTQPTYEGAGTGGSNTGAPAIFPAQAPLDGNHKYYNLLIHTASTSAFEIHASPTGSQFGDECGTFTLASSGQRGVLRSATGWTAERCWK